MKILMLGWELPPHNSGGLGVACYHMSKALALGGASIDFIVPYSAKHPHTEHMAVHAAVPLSPLARYSGFGAYDSEFAKNAESAGIRAVQKRYQDFVSTFVKDNSPDVIHAHDWLTMEAGIKAKELSGAPLIVHVHATEFDRSGERYGNPLVHEIEYQGLLLADRIIAVSEITKKMIVDRYNIPADKVEVMHNAIDPASFNDGYHYDARTYRYLEALKSEGYTVITTITRFTVQKGLTHLIRAAARACERHDKLVFLLVGDGEQRDELLELVADLGIADRVLFTGFIRGRQWRDAYSVGDIFVMSSVSEPFGLSALEAAHHDNALIITKQAGVGEVLRNVFHYDFWDIDALADRIIAIATSPALSDSLKRNVRREYARISWDDVAQKCISIYKQETRKAAI